MVIFEENRLKEIMEAGKQRQVLVIGDLMVDRYLWGNVTRLSPEAPVPIINIEDEEVRFGGAANVANNLIGLGATPILVGVVGQDRWGDMFKELLEKKRLNPLGVITDTSRPTTVKTRIIGNNQHIARVDREKIQPIADTVRDRILQFVESVIQEVDGIILQDYNKGVLIPSLIHRISQLAQRHHKIITVDPKFDNFLEFRNITLFKPNRKETEEALAMRLTDESEIRKAGQKLLQTLNSQAVLITLGEKGMALFEQGQEGNFMGTRAREVADVSGAGDTVIATVTFALTGGASMREAVTLANFAAGVVCEEVGVVAIEREKLTRSILSNQHLFSAL